IRTIRHRFSLERGRVSMISTRSPLWEAFCSSWAWQMVRRFIILPYFVCGTSRSTTTRRVLFILSDATIPISVLRRPRVDVVGLWAVLAWLIGYSFSRLAGFDSTRRRRGRADERSLALELALPQDRLDAGDLALRLDDLAGRLQALRLALEPE